MKIKTKIKSSQAFYFIEFLSFYSLNLYYWYRYILRYNTDYASAEYRDTPTFLRGGKYAVVVVLAVLLVLAMLYFKKKVILGGPEIALVLFAAIMLIKSMYQRNYLLFFKMLIFALPAYGVMYMGDDPIQPFIRWFRIVYVYHIIYSAFEIFMYFTFGWMTGLAIPGLIRFGGGLDDPNGFSIFMIIPLCYFICNLIENGLFSRWLPHAIVAFVLFFITYSFSGYAGAVVMLLLIMVKYKNSARLVLVETIILVIVAVVIINHKDLIIHLYEHKKYSIQAHFEYMIVRYDSLAEFIFGSPQYQFSESLYAMVAVNYGFGALLLLFFFECSTIYIAYRNYMREHSIELFTVFAYQVVFMVTQVGIAYFVTVPVNYLYFLAVFMTLRVYRSHGREKYADARRMPTVA